MKRVGVIGAGAFGTALASVLRAGGLQVTLWGRDPNQIQTINSLRVNQKYLPNATLPAGLQATNTLSDLSNADILLMVLPAQTLRPFLADVGPEFFQAPVMMCAKGIETSTGLLQQEIMSQMGCNAPIGLISGPGFATELTHGKPTALSLAIEDEALGKTI